MPLESDIRTIFSVVGTQDLPPPGTRRLLLLTAEAGLCAAASALIARQLGLGLGGVGSVLLSSAALQSRLYQLLRENRENVFDHKLGSLRSNVRTAASMCALFFGVLSAYVMTALYLDDSELERGFDFVLRAADLGTDNLRERTFAGAWAAYRHNFAILAAFVMLGFVYRSYGVLFALCWNGCVWGVALTVMVRRLLLTTECSVTRVLTGSLAAVVPHVVLEATAYVLASMAAIFLSKGVFLYSSAHPRLRKVGAAVLRILALAVLVLFLAALTESYWAPFMLGLFFANGAGGGC
ncbi:MAG: stage II sporulation protein M [Candidatus Schekmanbacteria bacterium]|nr:stage II sporulation protein M [Candidatus Schekmanbacteria bacterium]